MDDLQALEDEIALVVADLRAVRTLMKERELPTISLKSGTFRLFAGKLRLIAKNFLRDADKAAILAKQSKEAREAVEKAAEEAKAAVQPPAPRKRARR